MLWVYLKGCCMFSFFSNWGSFVKAAGSSSVSRRWLQWSLAAPLISHLSFPPLFMARLNWNPDKEASSTEGVPSVECAVFSSLFFSFLPFYCLRCTQNTVGATPAALPQTEGRSAVTLGWGKGNKSQSSSLLVQLLSKNKSSGKEIVARQHQHVCLVLNCLFF